MVACLFNFLSGISFDIIVIQGVYYYFYQIFRGKAEAIAIDHRKRGFGDGSVGMFSSLIVAAMSG